MISAAIRVYSSSALRFADEYSKVNKESLIALSSWGSGSYNNYSVHQLEPIVALMGVKAKRVMQVGGNGFSSLVIEFEGGRTAFTAHFSASPFMMQLCHGDSPSEIIHVESDFFANFIKSMIEFFETGKIIVPHEETITIMAIREAGFKAALTPYQWVLV